MGVMETLTANQAKTQFGDMLLKVQRAPVQISRNGKPVAVLLSVEDYQALEAIKLRLLQEKIEQARADIAAGKLVEGDALFSSLLNGEFD
ncbi:prevent-host-death family protein [Tolumonas auensis DSM 9187]|jgi:prevent-host-death family protein|uniref:Antitoxin n=2 Tax=Tolumonas TaxID=43947 RepID=C4L794_TOLAT|nr:type II toxin-antitoxin system Phd/YefM family antitoxin [Tolumonas auensis]ACQ91670.1 prevent-host-death family protein [Tolumonas auensis DSM 9187]